MAWCPKCKFEYVNGISVCPDCGATLVDDLSLLEEADDTQVTEEATVFNGRIKPEDLSDEEKAELISMYKRVNDNPPYKSKQEQLENHKSSAYVLTVAGAAGIIVLVLNKLGLIKLPFSGFSLTLTYAVLGCLFIVFLVSGIRSFGKIKNLTSEVATEQENIDKFLDYLRNNNIDSKYTATKGEGFEEDALRKSNLAVEDLRKAFPDLDPGFYFYVVDRFAGDILEGNED